MDKSVDRQRDILTYRQIDSEQIDWHIDRHADRQTDKYIDKWIWIYIYIYIYIYGKINRYYSILPYII